jgi:DNA-binding IclR family transcriptional regulator
MLACLEERFYVLRDGQSGRYYLSLKLFHLSHTHSPVEFLRDAAIGPMRRLTEKVRQACHLAILHHDTMMVLVRARSPLPVTLSVEEGTRFPLVYTVSGRLLLAFAEENLREEVLARNEEYLAMSQRARRAFKAHLQQIHTQGHHVAKSDITECVTDVGVPVGVAGSELFAALTLPCINTLLAECDQKVLLAAALTCAKEINDAIGLMKPINVVNGAMGDIVMNGRALQGAVLQSKSLQGKGAHPRQSRVARTPNATA